MSRTELTCDFPNGSMEYEKQKWGMLYTAVGILIVLWLLDFSMHVGSGLIHALLVIGARVKIVTTKLE